MKPVFPGFSAEALEFLRKLKRNNRRPWFLRNKETYDREVKGPMIELVKSLNEELRSCGSEFVTEPRRAIYRIYRDIRFSSDKSPYKTHIAALFAPQGFAKHACAGLYFHFSPQELLVAGGVYMPGPKELLAIRGYVAEHEEGLRRILNGKVFRRSFGEMEGSQLSRVPKGFSPTHPAADLLRFKQYLVVARYSVSLLTTSALLPTLSESFKLLLPFLRFLNAPLQPRKPDVIEL